MESAAGGPLLVDEGAINESFRIVMVVVDDRIDQLCWENFPRCWVGTIHGAGYLDSDIKNSNNIYSPP